MERHEIERDVPTPVYEQIAAVLAGEITRGVLPTGRRIPSEDALCERFGVARKTVRQALDVLRSAGHVETIERRGTYVVDHDRDEDGKADTSE